MDIRLILLDIDGTLTNSRKEITPRTKEILLKAQASGITLALSSGRPENGLYKFARELEMDTHNGLFICYNGARVLNCQTGEVYFNQAMSIEEGKAVLRHLKNFDAVPIINKDKYMYVEDVFNSHIDYDGEKFNVLSYEVRGNGFMLCEKQDLEDFADFELNKILTYASPEYLALHYKEMAAPFEGRLNMMFTSPFYYEYTALGIDKAKAIETALIPLGYKKENMIAFGDAQNDISMLKLAGIGVAMGNAVDEVKAIADEVTTSNNDDGIAVVLEKHLPDSVIR